VRPVRRLLIAGAALGAAAAAITSAASGFASGGQAGAVVARIANPVSALGGRPATVPGAAAGRYNVAASHSPQVERMLARGTAAGPDRPASAAAQTLGVDVSSRQHPNGAPVDWTQVAAAGYTFAFIKVSEGDYYVNPYYASDAAAASAAGLFTAAYEFAIPNNSSGTLQADLALNQVGAAAGGRTLPLILDAEYDPYVSEDHTNSCYGLTPARMVAWIGAFVAEVQRRTGQPPVIYTTKGWWNECTGMSTAFTADPLWIAAYTANPSLPAGWSQWNYQQYTSTATVPGISVQTDVSYFNPAVMTTAVPAAQSDPEGAAASLPVYSLNAAAGGTVTWSATGLPAGVSIDATTGLLSGGLPAVARSYHVAVTAADTAAGTQVVRFTWLVHGAVRLTWPGRQSTMAGASASVQIRAADRLAGCSLAFSATGLPPGLEISRCGWITGSAAAPGVYQVIVRAADSRGTPLAGTRFSWTVTAGPVVAAGPVRLGLPGWCLASLSGASTATPGAVPQVRRCGKTAGQQWEAAQNGSLSIAGECLTAVTTAEQPTLALDACTGQPAQVWQQAPGGGLLSAATGDCLADPGASQKAGTAVTLAACTGDKGQAWSLPPGPVSDGLPAGCLVLAATGPHDAKRVDLRRCATSPGKLAKSGQAWSIAANGTIADGTHCLTAPAPARAGSLVELSACGTTAAQRWLLLPGGAGTLIVSPASGLCLEAAAHPAATSPLELGYCLAGSPRLSWRST